LLKKKDGGDDSVVTGGLSKKSVKALKDLVKERICYRIDEKHAPLEKAFNSEILEVVSHVPSVDLKVLGKYGLVESVDKVTVITVQGTVYKMGLNEPVMAPFGFFENKKVRLSHKASRYVDICLEIAENQKKDRALLNSLIDEAQSWEEIIEAWAPASEIKPSNILVNKGIKTV
jgi:hypothetical protein